MLQVGLTIQGLQSDILRWDYQSSLQDTPGTVQQHLNSFNGFPHILKIVVLLTVIPCAGGTDNTGSPA